VDSLSELILLLREISISRYAGSLKERRKEIKGLLQSYPLLFDLRKADLIISLTEHKGEPDEIEKLALNLQRDYPEDGECVKLVGDWYFRKGDLGKARDSYYDAKSKLRDGIVLLELADQLEKIDDLGYVAASRVELEVGKSHE
jgi:hypothetical protein